MMARWMTVLLAAALLAAGRPVLAIDLGPELSEPTTSAPSQPASQPASRPATEPTSLATTQSASQPASAPTSLTWMTAFDEGLAQAGKADSLMLVFWFDPESPACQAMQDKTFAQAELVRALRGLALVRLDVTREGNKPRFAGQRAKRPPLTQTYSPASQLLDSLPGFLDGPGVLAMIQRSQQFLAADRQGRATPDDAQRRWAKVQARLALSSRAQAGEDIDWLLARKPGQLPPSITPARLQLALGQATQQTDPVKARQAFEQARTLAGEDTVSAACALLGLAELAIQAESYSRAHDLLDQYIREYPAGQSIGKVAIRKASIEINALDNRPAARATLEEFLRKYPDDPAVVQAKELLEALK